jgi:hypothetical protein
MKDKCLWKWVKSDGSVTILISRAKESDQVEEIIPHIVEGGLSILQYPAKNMKLIIYFYKAKFH